MRREIDLTIHDINDNNPFAMLNLKFYGSLAQERDKIVFDKFPGMKKVAKFYNELQEKP